MADGLDNGAPALPGTDTPTTTTATAPAAPAAPDWLAGLPKEVADVVAVKGWKSPADVITSYTNAEKRLGVSPDRLLRLPDADRATNPEAWVEFDAKMGVPPAPKEYANELGETFDADAFTALAVEAHKSGVSKAAFSAMQKTVAEHITKAGEKAEQALAAETTAWAEKNPGEHMGVKTLLARVSASEEEAGALLAGLGSKALGLLARIAKGSQEREIIAQTTPTALQGAAQARAEIARLRADKAFNDRYNSPVAAVRAGAIEEISRLYKLTAE